ncbi:MAG TPA: hypothetical protein VFM46_06395 [Pseudomonadales bacterium]|nr:hypothetical protein [Pseudomonadales bacterium]
MLYIALSVAFLFVMGSVMWLRPSPADKRLAGLRQTAASLGLRVSWLPSKETAWLQPPDRKWMRYACHRPSPKESLMLLRWLRTADGWLAIGHREAFPAQLQLPESVAALELTAHDCAIIWSEEGGEEAVQQIAQALKQFAQKN